jgi:hypothetical protein
MKFLVIVAAFMCLGAAGTQAASPRAADCLPLPGASVRVRLTLTADGVPIKESLIRSAVSRVWGAKGLRVDWAAAPEPSKKLWDDVDLWVNFRKSEIAKAVDTAANKLSREYLIQPISAHHLLFTERQGAVEEVLGDTVSEEIRKFLSSAQCEQGR